MTDKDLSFMPLSVLQALPQPIIVVSDDRTITFVNYAAEAFFGASLSVLSRHKLDDLIAFGSPIVGLVAAVSERRAPMTEYRVRVDSSRFGDASNERIVDAFASPISELDGRVALLFQERTMADKIDRQLVSRGAARSVTGLASMLAHEIKNPLSGIRGAAQLLEQSVTPEELPLARLVREEVDRIVDLIDKVEVFGDDRPIEREPINIHVILDRVKLLAKNGVYILENMVTADLAADGVTGLHLAVVNEFDAIVLDPPKLAPTGAHAERAARAYKDINRLGFKLLRPGGVLFTFSCSGGVGVELFHKIVAAAGLEAGVDGVFLQRLGGAPDHPMTVQFPEGEYLKGLVVMRRPGT